jgi:hypothetical protein
MTWIHPSLAALRMSRHPQSRAAKEEVLDRPLSEQVESERNQGLEQQH